MKPDKNTVTEVYEDRYKNNCYATVNYYINEQKRVIACKIEPGIETEPFDLFADNTSNITYKTSMEKGFFEMCEDEGISFTGKAVCLAEDEFNVQFGKNLAYDKAMFKMLDAKRRFIEKANKYLEKRIEANNLILDDITKQLDKVTERFENKIKEVM